jgi:hypothetical protein
LKAFISQKADNIKFENLCLLKMLRVNFLKPNFLLKKASKRWWMGLHQQRVYTSPPLKDIP